MSLYSPLGLEAASIDGQRTDVSAQRERGRNAYSLVASVPARTVRSLNADLGGVVRLTRDGWYELDIGHQPTVRSDRLHVSIQVPDGWRIAEVQGLERQSSREAAKTVKQGGPERCGSASSGTSRPGTSGTGSTPGADRGKWPASSTDLVACVRLRSRKRTDGHLDGRARCGEGDTCAGSSAFWSAVHYWSSCQPPWRGRSSTLPNRHPEAVPVRSAAAAPGRRPNRPRARCRGPALNTPSLVIIGRSPLWLPASILVSRMKKAVPRPRAHLSRNRRRGTFTRSPAHRVKMVGATLRRAAVGSTRVGSTHVADQLVDLLARSTRTDNRASETNSPHYRRHLGPIRFKKNLVLEIGVVETLATTAGELPSPLA